MSIYREYKAKLFNVFVDSIDNHINDYMGKMQEIELTRSGLLDFADFFDIKYDTDSEGQVYPDVYSEFETGVENDKKKKGKGGKLPIEPMTQTKKPTL